jgi:hypothetical protein
METLVNTGRFPSPDTLQDYIEEQAYYEDHHEYYPPEEKTSLVDVARKGVVGIRNFLDGAVKVRDELYGYNKDSKEPRIHLKPAEDMKFLPAGMGDGSSSDGGFGFGMQEPDMSMQLPQWGEKKEPPKPRAKCKCRGKLRKHSKRTRPANDEDPEVLSDSRPGPESFDPSYIPPSLRDLF